jgi:hypothetical protein
MNPTIAITQFSKFFTVSSLFMVTSNVCGFDCEYTRKKYICGMQRLNPRFFKYKCYLALNLSPGAEFQAVGSEIIGNLFTVSTRWAGIVRIT